MRGQTPQEKQMSGTDYMGIFSPGWKGSPVSSTKLLE